ACVISAVSCVPCSCSISFQYYHAHPVLHSFPTRRSSDLASRLNSPFFGFFTPCPAYTCPDAAPTSAAAGGVRSPPAPARARRRRSEEHTSELQSRFDLVCRLLLEKKNR